MVASAKTRPPGGTLPQLPPPESYVHLWSIELDGQHHRSQPLYDASRETAIVAATGWLCGRFTWAEVVHYRAHTVRRLADLVEQARRRPLS
jgi:very-short-patch-repair endonuclease